MGKITQGLNTAALRTGNTIATPLRRGGEIGNAIANIPRQGYSSSKNITEVTRQTRDALVDNFLNFSKVEGKWYQKMLKVPLNLASAVSRRPAMIAASGVVSGLNQGIRQPFKKLLYTPGKMFKGMRNATRIFSKKKGFDFQSYDTHETGKDTWVNKIKEGGIGFLGVKGGSSEKPTESEKPKESKIEENKIEEKAEPKPIEVKKEEKPVETKKVDDKKEEIPQGGKEKKTEHKKDKDITKPTNSNNKPKSIDDLKKKSTEEAVKKDEEEKTKNFPEGKTLDKQEKSDRRKQYKEALKNNSTKEGIIAGGKEAKMGENPEGIVKDLKEKEPTFAGNMEEESLNQAA